jgi:four helix bundle protein
VDSAQLRVDRGQTTVDTASAAGKILSHRDLLVWQKAMDLVDSIYDIAEGFPANESYRLTSQITRAVVSVPANIAEGQARSTAKDFANFLSIAKGSLMETETLLTVAVRRSYVTETVASVAFAQITEISKMPTSLRSRVRMSKRRLQ